MGESFVDVSYRGLELGRRLKLRDVGAEAGYVEIPLPMPVGTRVEIATDEGLRIEATVASVHEQVGGSEAHPGMRIRPVLTGAAATWWKERAKLAEAPPPAPVVPAAAAAPVTDTPAAAMQRPTMVMGAATIEAALAAADELEGYKDDGKRTEMMAAVEVPEEEAGEAAKATTVMDAIDISMITGRASTEVGAAHGEEDDEVEMSIESDDVDGESSGEISTELPATPSGATEKSGANGKPRTRGGRSGKKRGKKR